MKRIIGQRITAIAVGLCLLSSSAWATKEDKPNVVLYQNESTGQVEQVKIRDRNGSYVTIEPGAFSADDLNKTHIVPATSSGSSAWTILGYGAQVVFYTALACVTLYGFSGPSSAAVVHGATWDSLMYTIDKNLNATPDYT